MLRRIEWLFFDVGSTLVNESRANEHRILDAIKGTNITYDQAYIQAVQLAKQKNAHPLKALGLPVTPWHSEDETVIRKRQNALQGCTKNTRSVLLPTKFRVRRIE